MHMEKKHLIALVVFAVLALAVLAVVPPPASLTQEETVTDTSLLLGTYAGVTPCADCPGIQTELTLVRDSASSAEGTYRLSLTYLERDVEPYVAAGIWTTERGTPSDPDATVFALDPDMPDQTQRYLKTSKTTIRQLDREGNEIDASMPFDLTLVPADLP